VLAARGVGAALLSRVPIRVATRLIRAPLIGVDYDYLPDALLSGGGGLILNPAVWRSCHSQGDVPAAPGVPVWW